LKLFTGQNLTVNHIIDQMAGYQSS